MGLDDWFEVRKISGAAVAAQFQGNPLVGISTRQWKLLTPHRPKLFELLISAFKTNQKSFTEVSKEETTW